MAEESNNQLVLSVSDFVAIFNQTIEYAYPRITIVGELANFRISKNRWVYFDLKDELAIVKFFGTVYHLPGPLEDGLMLQVTGSPRLHTQFGFSINIQSIQPVGEGSLKRAAALLESKLRAEGLFDLARKRPLAYPPRTVGLITSSESAAYADFVKIINQRWVGLDISLADVQVQGDVAPSQVIAAIEYFNQSAVPPELIVITRGGGSAEDLAAFNNELLVRAIAASRIPTLVAIGHEVDVSLAELVADKRASTPSNAAEILVPDKRHEQQRLIAIKQSISHYLEKPLAERKTHIKQQITHMNQIIVQQLTNQKLFLNTRAGLLNALNPTAILGRGYSLTRDSQTGRIIRSVREVKLGQDLNIQLKDGQLATNVTGINKQREIK